MTEELIDRSDLYILQQMEAAASCGDVCAHRRLSDEMRRRLYRLRMEQMLYHVDELRDKAPTRCDQ